MTSTQTELGDRALEVALVHRLCADGTARRLRMKNGLSLREIGEACGVDLTTIYRWENGERAGRTNEHLLAYAELLRRLVELEVVVS